MFLPLFYLRPAPHGRELQAQETIQHILLVLFVKWLLLPGVVLSPALCDSFACHLITPRSLQLFSVLGQGEGGVNNRLKI